MVKVFERSNPGRRREKTDSVLKWGWNIQMWIG
jgi:hypothetical protein